MKQTRLWMLALPMLLGLAACSNNDNPATPDTPAFGVDSQVVGTWYAEVTGTTYALWNIGEVWQKTELKADGTGTTDIYYLYGSEAAACEHTAFTYTTTDGMLTMDLAERGKKLSAKYTSNGDKLLLTEGIEQSWQKVDSDMAAKFDEWSREDNLIDVPQPARYTVLVYGNCGGYMDDLIENGFWKQVQPLLTDHNNVRVVNMYKYGKKSNSKYGYDGDVVWFELTDQTDLTKLKESGLQSLGLGDEAKALKLCDPSTLREFVEVSSLLCPAEEYVFVIWGHGSGLKPMTDVPGKYDGLDNSRTRGVMYDEWNADEELDMYEFSAAIKSTGIDRLSTIFFHNCLMGNLETLAELRDVTDYMVASAHILYSEGESITEFVRGLLDTDNVEDATAQMFNRFHPAWDNGYKGTETVNNVQTQYYANGDLKLIRVNKLDAVISEAKLLAERLVALYPTQQEAIGKATKSVYRFTTPSSQELNFDCPFIDLADYAHKLAENTGDAELRAISQRIDDAFKDAFIHYADVNWVEGGLEHYTLSVCLCDNAIYTYDYVNDKVYAEKYNLHFLCNFGEGYEQTTFHKLTGWGRWLNINLDTLWGNPTGKSTTPYTSN